MHDTCHSILFYLFNDSVELKGIRGKLISLKALSVSSATYILLNAKKLNPQDLQR